MVEDTSLIFSFIQKKAEFDRHIGAFSGVLRVSEDKIRNTLFTVVPFAYVLFAETADRLFDLNEHVRRKCRNFIRESIATDV